MIQMGRVNARIYKSAACSSAKLVNRLAAVTSQCYLPAILVSDSISQKLPFLKAENETTVNKNMLSSATM